MTGRTHTLDELLDRFEREYLDMNSISQKRRTEQLVLLRKLAATLDHSLDRLTGAEVRAFIGAEMKAGLHPNTGTKHLSMIRSFIIWADAAGLIEEMRFLKLQSVRNPRGTGISPPKPYKAAEIHQFREVLQARLPVLPSHGENSLMFASHLRQRANGKRPRLARALKRHAMRLQFEAQVSLALEAGLRRIEIYRLSIPALHYDNDELIVLTAKQGPGSDVTRVIPYTQHARACVRQWLDFRWQLEPEHDFPWLHFTSKGEGLAGQLAPMPFYYFGRSLEKTFGHQWEWHRFRHTAATEWLRSGVPLEKVQVFMGHHSVEMTLRYTEILKRDIAEAFGAAEEDFARRLGLAA